jgi:import receptor subunit TOM22
MVELVEVEDESFETKQVGPSDDEDDYTDTGMLNCTSQRKPI